MDRDEGPWMGAIGQGRQDQHILYRIDWTFYSLGGFWLGGILAWGDIDWGDLVWGDFGLGGFCQGGFCPGGFCPGGFCPEGFCPVTGVTTLTLDVYYLVHTLI